MREIAEKISLSWTEERKQLWARQQSEWWQDPEEREKRIAGITEALNSPEYLDWASARMMERYEDPEERARTGVITKQMWADGVYDGVFQSPTSIETETIEALEELGIDHISQYRPPGYSQIYDEYIEPNVFIEVNGDYWHANPQRFEDDQLDKRQKDRLSSDRKKRKWAEQHGFHLIVLWENEIRQIGAMQLLEQRLLPLLPDGFQYTSNPDVEVADG